MRSWWYGRLWKGTFVGTFVHGYGYMGATEYCRLGRREIREGFAGYPHQFHPLESMLQHWHSIRPEFWDEQCSKPRLVDDFRELIILSQYIRGLHSMKAYPSTNMIHVGLGSWHFPIVHLLFKVSSFICFNRRPPAAAIACELSASRHTEGCLLWERKNGWALAVMGTPNQKNHGNGKQDYVHCQFPWWTVRFFTRG